MQSWFWVLESNWYANSLCLDFNRCDSPALFRMNLHTLVLVPFRGFQIRLFVFICVNLWLKKSAPAEIRLLVPYGHTGGQSRELCDHKGVLIWSQHVMMPTAYHMNIVCTGYQRSVGFFLHSTLSAPDITGLAPALHPETRLNFSKRLWMSLLKIMLYWK